MSAIVRVGDEFLEKVVVVNPDGTSVGGGGVTVAGPAGQSAANADLLTGGVNGWYDANAFQSASIQVIASAGITAGQIIFEQTNHLTLAPNGAPLRAVEASGISGNPFVVPISVLANTQRVFKVQIDSRYIRIRISTPFVGGTVQAVAVFSQVPTAYAVTNAQQADPFNLQTASVNQDNVFFAESTTPLAISGAITSATRDTGVAVGQTHRYSAFNAIAFADQPGTLRLEMSTDNATWRRATIDNAVAANTPLIVSIPVCARFHRAVFTNGATAQTAFMLNTSLTAS